MKCLSVKQPWAWAIVAGFKSVENRTWVPSPKLLRIGEPFLIHASQKFDLPGYRWMLANCEPLGLALDEIPARSDFTLGAIVGGAVYGGQYQENRPVGFFESAVCSPWFFGPKGWVICEALPLEEPIECRGQLGLWDVDEALSFQRLENTGSLREACPTKKIQ
jgi:hypothetical protein